jgi:hypothetical protein
MIDWEMLTGSFPRRVIRRSAVGLLDLRSYDIRGYGRVMVVKIAVGKIGASSFVRQVPALGRDASIVQNSILLVHDLTVEILFLTLALAVASHSRQFAEAPPPSLVQPLQ